MTESNVKEKYKFLLERIVESIWPKSTIKKFAWFGRGYNSVVFDVEISKPAKKMVIKIVEKEFSVDHREKEKKVYQLLKSKFSNFPVPEIYVIDSSKKVIDKTFTVSERIDGVPLGSVWNQLPNKDEVMIKFGEYLGMIHSICFQKYGDLSANLELTNQYSDWKDHQSEKMLKTFGKLRQLHFVDQDYLSRQSDFWDKFNRVLNVETSPILCWGDSGFGNIIVKAKNSSYEISGLIDFEYANAGGVVQDIFGRVRSFQERFSYKDKIAEGHSQYTQLPEGYPKLALLYHWVSNMEELANVPNMKWYELNEAETEKRKKEIVVENVKRISKTAELICKTN